MTYRSFYVLVEIEGSVKSFDILAIDIDAAMADIRAAYGAARLVQYRG